MVSSLTHSLINTFQYIATEDIYYIHAVKNDNVHYLLSLTKPV